MPTTSFCHSVAQFCIHFANPLNADAISISVLWTESIITGHLIGGTTRRKSETWNSDSGPSQLWETGKTCIIMKQHAKILKRFASFMRSTIFSVYLCFWIAFQVSIDISFSFLLVAFAPDYWLALLPDSSSYENIYRIMLPSKERLVLSTFHHLVARFSHHRSRREVLW